MICSDLRKANRREIEGRKLKTGVTVQHEDRQDGLSKRIRSGT